MSAYPFLVHVTDFSGQKSRHGQQNILCKLLEAIPFWHTILLGICDCHFLPSAWAEASYAAKFLSAHKQFSQQKICLKLRNYIMLSNSFHIIRFSLCSIYVKNLTTFIIDSSACQFCSVIHTFQLSCVSEFAKLGLIEVTRAHNVLRSQDLDCFYQL